MDVGAVQVGPQHRTSSLSSHARNLCVRCAPTHRPSVAGNLHTLHIATTAGHGARGAVERGAAGGAGAAPSPGRRLPPALPLQVSLCGCSPSRLPGVHASSLFVPTTSGPAACVLPVLDPGRPADAAGARRQLTPSAGCRPAITRQAGCSTRWVLGEGGPQMGAGTVCRAASAAAHMCGAAARGWQQRQLQTFGVRGCASGCQASLAPERTVSHGC